MIGSFLRKVKEIRRGEVLKNQDSKRLKINGKPNSPIKRSINSTSQKAPRGHSLWRAATTHLIWRETPKSSLQFPKKKKKLFTFHGRHDMSRRPQNPKAADGTNEINYRRIQYYRRDHPHGRTETNASITDEGIRTIQYCQ